MLSLCPFTLSHMPHLRNRYGQTGSGKTFTLTGGAERYVDRGLIPRTLAMIYGEFAKRGDTQFQAYISYLELYNEQGYDLLSDSDSGTSSLEVHIYQPWLGTQGSGNGTCRLPSRTSPTNPHPDIMALSD